MRQCLLYACFVLTLLLPAAAAQSDPDYIRADRLGITFISSIDVPHDEMRYQQALELGAGWNRWPLYWDRVETQRGRFEWEAYDDLLIADIGYGLRHDVVLLGIPRFHRNGSSIGGLFEPVFADGSDRLAAGGAINPQNPWARFVAAAVERYRPGGTLARAQGWEDGLGVRVWEIWNEPDFRQFWDGGVADYARLLKVAYLAIKSIDPEATVMVGGLLYNDDDRNWLADMLRIYYNEFPQPHEYNWYFDAVAVHSYGDSWRSGWLVLYVRQTLVEYGLERPIWLNESGVAVWNDYPGPTWAEAGDETRSTRASAAQQAAFLIQSSAYAWAEGASVVFFHQLYDDCGDQPPGSDFPPHNGSLCRGGRPCYGDAFGIFRNTRDSVCYSRHPRPGSARPAAAAYRLLADVFGTEPFSRRGIIEDGRVDGAILVTFYRPRTRERVIVIWNTRTRELTIELPAAADSATLVTLAGEATIAPADGFYRLALPAAEAPRQRFLEERIPVDIGGMPVIIIEALGDEDAALLAFRTYETTEAPIAASTPVPSPSGLSETEVAALIARSPTGAAFVSLNNARLRDAPNTETSSIVGTLPFNNAATITGRTRDNGWLQVDNGGARVWVAAFLGRVYGDLSGIPIVEATAPTAAEGGE
ncbi:MAG: SH3 domain-containing protein [Aggregatilineales bacterium]